MARKDALLRLHKRLIAKRDALRKKLNEELDQKRPKRSDVGDLGDEAHDGTENEINSQIAALESRELAQVERAIELIREGRYGICEMCEQPIPIARLKALPFTPLCVKCQRELEEGGQESEDLQAKWANAYEFEGRMNDRELTMRDLDIEL